MARGSRTARSPWAPARNTSSRWGPGVLPGSSSSQNPEASDPALRRLVRPLSEALWGLEHAHDNALTTPQSGLYCAPLAVPAAMRRGGRECGPSFGWGPFPQAQRRGVLFKSLAGNLCGDSRLKAFGEKTE